MTMRQYLCVVVIFLSGFFLSEFLKKKERFPEQSRFVPVGEEILLFSSDNLIKYKLVPHNIQIDGQGKKVKDFDKNAQIYFVDLGNHVLVACTKRDQ